MESLLRWGVTNSDNTTNEPPAAPREPLDPKWLDAILGKSDADRMKESLEVARDENKDLDDRLTALDNLEMLIEQIDNANNLTPLKMWEPLIELSKSPINEIRMNVLWVLGTAVQNNPHAQQAYLKYDHLPAVLSVLSPDESNDAATRAKAIYLLSGATRHYADAVEKLDSVGGWDLLKVALTDSSIQVRRKVAFFLNSLLLQDDAAPTNSLSSSTPLPPNIHTGDAKPSTRAAAYDPPPVRTSTSGLVRDALSSSKAGIVSALTTSLATPLPFGEAGDEGLEGDLDYEEKSLRTLLTYLQHGGQLTAEEKQTLKSALGRKEKQKALVDWALDEEDWKVLDKAVA